MGYTCLFRRRILVLNTLRLLRCVENAFSLDECLCCLGALCSFPCLLTLSSAFATTYDHQHLPLCTHVYLHLVVIHVCLFKGNIGLIDRHRRCICVEDEEVIMVTRPYCYHSTCDVRRSLDSHTVCLSHVSVNPLLARLLALFLIICVAAGEALYTCLPRLPDTDVVATSESLRWASIVPPRSGHLQRGKHYIGGKLRKKR